MQQTQCLGGICWNFSLVMDSESCAYILACYNEWYDIKMSMMWVQEFFAVLLQFGASFRIVWIRVAKDLGILCSDTPTRKHGCLCR